MFLALSKEACAALTPSCAFCRSAFACRMQSTNCKGTIISSDVHRPRIRIPVLAGVSSAVLHLIFCIIKGFLDSCKRCPRVCHVLLFLSKISLCLSIALPAACVSGSCRCEMPCPRLRHCQGIERQGRLRITAVPPHSLECRRS